MELFPDNRTLSLCLIEMSTYIRNYYCERLNSIPEIGWTIDSGARTGQHDVCGAQVHLYSAHRLAVAVMLGESAYSPEPFTSIGHAAVHKMRKQVGRH